MSSDAQRVELTYQDRRLTGTVAGVPLDLPIELPMSAGSARGTYGSDAISATWSIASNYNASEQPASLEATFAHEVVSLTSTLRLTRGGPRLISADVLGSSGDDPVSVHVSPGTDQWSSIVLDGQFGTVAVSLVAMLDALGATIRGAIDGEPVELTATRTETNWRTLEIVGRWHGPPSLCVFAAAALSYFI